MGYLGNTERTANVIAKTDVSLIKVNELILDQVAEATQLRFLKVFVQTLIGRLSHTTDLLTKMKKKSLSS